MREFTFKEMYENSAMLRSEGVEPQNGLTYTDADVDNFKSTWFPLADDTTSRFQHKSMASENNAEVKVTSRKMVIFTFHFLDACSNYRSDDWAIEDVYFDKVFPPTPTWLPPATENPHRTMWRNLFWLYYGFNATVPGMIFLPNTPTKRTGYKLWYAAIETADAKLIHNGQVQELTWKPTRSYGHCQASGPGKRI